MFKKPVYILQKCTFSTAVSSYYPYKFLFFYCKRYIFQYIFIIYRIPKFLLLSYYSPPNLYAFFLSIFKKNGAPNIEVITPIGVSWEVKRLLVRASVIIRNTPPMSMAQGMTFFMISSHQSSCYMWNH